MTLTIDEFPEELYEQLQQYAAENSINLRTATVMGLMRGLSRPRPFLVLTLPDPRSKVRA